MRCKISGDCTARRVVVWHMVERGMRERRARRVVGMSASSLRYVPAPDWNTVLRAKIFALAHRASPIRRGDDPPEAAAGRRASQPQAGPRGSTRSSACR